MSSNSGLMNTEVGGENTQYESIHTVTKPHKKSGGQFGGTSFSPCLLSSTPPSLQLHPPHQSTPPSHTQSTILTPPPSHRTRNQRTPLHKHILRPQVLRRQSRRRRCHSREDQIWTIDFRDWVRGYHDWRLGSRGRYG